MLLCSDFYYSNIHLMQALIVNCYREPFLEVMDDIEDLK